MGAEQSSRTNKEEPKLSQAEVQKLLNAQRKMYEKKCQQIVENAQEAQSCQATPMRQSVPVQHTMPMQQTYMPMQNHNMPMHQSNIYVQQPNIPMQQPNIPVQQPTIPMQQPNISVQQPNISVQQPNIPMRQPNIPVQQPNISMQQSNMPMHQSVPQSHRMMMQHTVSNNSSGTTVQSPENASQENISIERQRTPYSYGREELFNIRENIAASPQLYPNLNNPGASHTSGSIHTFDFNKRKTSPEDFVMVNSDGRVERPQPSAPARSHSNSRSASRSRDNDVNNGFKCCACREMFGLQIFQCNSGHSLCSDCHKSRRPCNNCGATSSSRRNYDLEKIIAEIKVPCQHKNNGCRLFVKAADMELHLKECPFKELQCPVGCYWKGQLKQLAAHFDSSHPDQRKADVDTEIRLDNISNNTTNSYLVLIGSFHFLFHVKVFDRNVYMTAQLIGTKMSASKWSYEVHVYNKNESRRKYLYTDICSSYAESLDDIFKEGRCSVLPFTYASTLVNNGALNYKFYVKQTIETKPRVDFRKNQRVRGK